MAYSKVFNRVNWENEPSLNTPLNENNLNKSDYALNEIDNRVVAMSVQMDNLNGYETRAAQSATDASASATASANSATQSQGYAQQAAAAAAAAAEDTAEDLEQAMAGYVSDAQGYATQSQNHANTSLGYANDSADSAVDAEAWANGQRHGVDVQSTDETYHNNAKYWQERANYWYLQAQQIAESFSGALRPMGTVTFANLPDVEMASAGDMYNVSDEFTTTSDFVEGAGIVVPLGTNVYLTTQNKWDILAGSPVTGVKGNSESFYRKGNVNITKANIGLGNVDNESLGSADISAIGDGSVKGAISQINSDLTGKQAKTDNSLKTSNKQIVGAINEVYNRNMDFLKSSLISDNTTRNYKMSDNTGVLFISAGSSTFNVTYVNGLYGTEHVQTIAGNASLVTIHRTQQDRCSYTLNTTIEGAVSLIIIGNCTLL